MKTNLATHLQSAASNTNDIRDIRPPLEIPYEWLWLWISLAAVALIAGIVTWQLLRKKKALVPAVPAVPPHLRAKQRLAEALRFINDPNRFCTEVSSTLRIYLEERFNLRAPERTTEEFLVELRTSMHLTIDQKQSLGEFLESCDLVKFARHEPTEDNLRQLHDAALRLVDETQFIEVAAPASAAVAAGSISPQPANASASLADPTRQMSGEEPISFKDRLIGFGIAAVLILIGVAMWMWPDLGLVPEGAHAGGRGSNRIIGFLRLLEWFWSRPVGAIFAIVGAAVVYGVFTRRTKGPDQ